jgi:hypothetical protein
MRRTINYHESIHDNLKIFSITELYFRGIIKKLSVWKAGHGREKSNDFWFF